MRNLPRRSHGFNVFAGVVIGLAFAAVIAYTVAIFGSQSTTNITVRDKERVCSSNGDTTECKYLIYANEGVYQNTDVLLQGKFNSSDIYNDLQPGQTYSVKYWGWRIPFLSAYPNILEVN